MSWARWACTGASFCRGDPRAGSEPHAARRIHQGASARAMKLVKSLAILLLVFAAGLVVGGWSSEIVRIVKVWLGLQDRRLANQGPTIAQGSLSSGKRWE